MNDELWKFSPGPMGVRIEEKLPPFVKGSETSLEAAKAIRGHTDTKRAAVLSYIAAQGLEGATDEEIQLALNMQGSTQRPRRVDLVDSGEIRKIGERKTKSGRMASVWGVL